MHFNVKTVQRTFIVVLHDHTNPSNNFSFIQTKFFGQYRKKTRGNRSLLTMLLNGSSMDHLMRTSSCIISVYSHDNCHFVSFKRLATFGILECGYVLALPLKLVLIFEICQ